MLLFWFHPDLTTTRDYSNEPNLHKSIDNLLPNENQINLDKSNSCVEDSGCDRHGDRKFSDARSTNSIESKELDSEGISSNIIGLFIF